VLASSSSRIVIVALYSSTSTRCSRGLTASRRRVARTAQNHIYLRLFWKSTQMSLIVSVIVVLLAYPVAYTWRCRDEAEVHSAPLLIAPFLTSYSPGARVEGDPRDQGL